MLQEDGIYTAHSEIHSLYPLKKAELYRRGNAVAAFDVTGREGEVHLTHSFRESENSWYLLRVEDVRGHWCITSPIYFEPEQAADRPFASAIIFEISNHSRFVDLRKEFFAHIIVTVSPDDPITEVKLIKDGEAVQSFTPGMKKNELPSGKKYLLRNLRKTVNTL